MINLIGSVMVGYLAGSGLATTTCVAGRGLVRAGRRAVEGKFGEAAVEALGAVTAPALMSYAATVALAMDVVEAGFELTVPLLRGAERTIEDKLAA